MWVVRDKRTGNTFETSNNAVIEAIDKNRYVIEDMTTLYGGVEPTVTTKRKKKSPAPH